MTSLGPGHQVPVPAQPRPARTPLSPAAVRAAVLPGSLLFTGVEVVPRTGSTNADLLAEARTGAAAGSVLVAEEQTAGRGRLDRKWHSEPGAALTFSVLLRPSSVPPSRRGWLPLLAGVAVASAVGSSTGVEVSLKWPNDVLAGPGSSAGPRGVSGPKLAGILAEQAGDAIVLGIGINVSATEDELPSGQATSLWLAGGTGLDRQAILVAMLGDIERWYLRWSQAPAPGDADAAGLRAAYLRVCSTIGRDVRVELPGGSTLAGHAIDVDALGRLLVSEAGNAHAVSAGDVVHVR
jgi:BirA family transcriptional regulator, biotin operon repressor / biotin---[acetyl-CoA-carboxylase] ligase